jgi:hypothetical protein
MNTDFGNWLKNGSPEFDFDETRFEKLFSTMGRLNIYSLGATVTVAAFLFWMVPDLLVTIGKGRFQTLFRLKWVLLGLVLVGGRHLCNRQSGGDLQDKKCHHRAAV